MSFAALKDKRNARRPRVPLAAGVGSISTSAFATAPTTAPVPIPTTGAAASAVLTTQPTTANAQGKKEQPQPLTESDSENLRYTDFPEEILQIRTTRQSGRGIYVRSDLGKDLTAGTTIIATSPTEAVLSTSQLEEYCSSCFLGVHELEFSPSRKVAAGAGGSKVVLFACGGCRVARYCSKTCQSHAWGAHKQECRALQRLRGLYHSLHSQSGSFTGRSTAIPVPSAGKRGKERPWIPEESVRALGRICWARRIRLRESKQTSEEDQWWTEIEGLQSHRESLSAEQRQPFAQLAMTLAQYLAAGEASPGQEDELKAVDMRDFGFRGVGEMMDLVCAFATNSFTISTPSLTPIGVSISPFIALINHSCVPNAAVVFPFGCSRGSVGVGGRNAQLEGTGKGMRVVLIRDVQPGEEIVTSYIDVSLPRHIRQQDLTERYHFTCSCSLCQRYAARMTEKGKGKGRLVDPRWCMFHPSCEKNGLIPLPINQEQGDLICPACGKSADIQLDKVSALVALATQIVQSDERGQLSVEEGNDIPALVEHLSTLLPTTSYPLLPLLRLHALQLLQPASTAVVVHMSRNAETGLGPNLFPAIRVHSILVHALDAVLPVNHPSVGIALAELGKLLNVHVDDESASSAPGESQVDLGNGFLIPRGTSQRLPLALSTLRRAWETLQIGFGGERDVEGGVVAWEVKVLVEGLERELQLRRRA